MSVFKEGDLVITPNNEIGKIWCIDGDTMDREVQYCNVEIQGRPMYAEKREWHWSKDLKPLDKKVA